MTRGQRPDADCAASGYSGEKQEIMAIDPVERIRTFAHETSLALELISMLERLSALPPATEAPYLTVNLDWRPDGSEPGRIPPPEPKRSQRRAHRQDPGLPRRPSRLRVLHELDGLVDQHGPQGLVFDSLSADLERIEAYLDGELDPAAKGVVIVACHAQGVFEPVPLDVPVTTSVVTGPIPSLRELVHAAEDYPPYAVLVADGREAFLWLMERRTWERTVHFEASDYPRKQQQGGWSQRRYQARADERVEHFAKTVAEETRRVLTGAIESTPEDGSRVAVGQADRGDPIPLKYLVIAADEPMRSALPAEFHETVTNRIIGEIHLPVEANISQVVAAAEPVVEQHERRLEADAVQAVREGAGAGTDGVAGAEETLLALESGVVLTLVMNDDFAMDGWADFTFPLYGVGEVPAEHPAGGDVANIVPVALADALVLLALRSDAAVEFVRTSLPMLPTELAHVPDASEPKPRAETARALDELGGVGAILRFSRREHQSAV